MTDNIPPKYRLGDRKAVYEELPLTVRSIGDWAYSGCINLKEISLPAGCKVSSKAFAGCDKLERIMIRDKEGRQVCELPELLAAAVRAWPEESGRLLTEGSDRGLCEKTDELLPAFITEPDDLGFQPFRAGGEEDYASEDEERDTYISRRRELKLRLCYERVLAVEKGFPDTNGGGKICEDYIRNCSIPENTGLALRYPDRKAVYAALYLERGYYRPAPADELLDAAGDPELRSLILKYAGNGSGPVSVDTLMI